MTRVGDRVYHTTQWRKLRDSYYRRQHGVCERCGSPGDVVHHKVYITSDNVNDPNVTMNEKFLELLCHFCHNKEHKGYDEPMREGLEFDGKGNLKKVF